MTEDLTRVSQFIDSVESSGGELYQALHDIFDADYEPGPVHLFLARTAPLLRERNQLQVILTTNYDDALERAFEKAGEPYDLITYIASSPKEYRGRFMHWAPGEPPRVIESANDDRLGPDKRTVILKLHGAVQRLGASGEDNYVITEDHYIEYLTRMDLDNLIPVKVLERLRNCHFLFMGYSLADWNLRAILHRLWSERRRDRDWWAIQVEPSDLERRSWRRRGVDIFDIPLGEYIEELNKRFGEAVGSGS